MIITTFNHCLTITTSSNECWKLKLATATKDMFMKRSGGLYCYLISCNGGSAFVTTQKSLSNTCMNYFAYSMHLSFVCCLVVTCFSVLLFVVLRANSNSTTTIICSFKLLLCIDLNLLFEVFVVH